MKSEKNVWKKLLSLFLVFIGIIIVLLLYNEAPFLYSESDEYRISDTNNLIDPNCAPIHQFDGNDKAMLFVHGLPSCPNTYIYFAERAREKGYDVIAPLLPGFGTRHEDLYDQTFSGWYRYLSEQYEKYVTNYSEFYVVGLSMGGALTLKIAEEYSDTELAPTAVAATAAPVFLNNIRYGVIDNIALYFIRNIAWFVKEVPSTSPEYYESYPDGGHRWRGYFSYFPKQLQSFKMGLKTIMKNLDKITVPIYLAHDINDTTVPSENFDYIAENVSSEVKMLRLINMNEIEGISPEQIDHTHHLLYMYDSTREMMFDEINDFFSSL